MVLMLYGATLTADAAWQLRDGGGGDPNPAEPPAADAAPLGPERASRAVTALRQVQGFFLHCRAAAIRISCVD
jgi:hypothetical protein